VREVSLWLKEKEIKKEEAAFDRRFFRWSLYIFNGFLLVFIISIVKGL